MVRAIKAMEYAHIDRITRLGVSFFFISFIFAAVESKPTTGSDDATESLGGFESKLGPSQGKVDASTTEVLLDASHRDIMHLSDVPTSKWRTDVFSNISDQQPALEGNSSGLNKFTTQPHPTGNLSKSENAGNIPDKNESSSRLTDKIIDEVDSKHGDLVRYTDAKNHKDSTYLSGTKEDRKVDERELETLAASNVKVVINSSGSDVIKSNATSEKETTLSDSADRKHNEISNDTEAKSNKNVSYLSDSRVTKKDKKMDGRELDTLASSYFKVVINSSSSNVIKSNATSEKETTLSDSAASKHNELSNDTDANRHKNSSYLSDSRVTKKDKKVDGRELETLASSNVKVVINSSGSNVIKSNATSEEEITLSDSNIVKEDRNVNISDLNTLSTTNAKFIIDSTGSNMIKVKVLPGHEANIPAASQRVNTIATDDESATDGVNHNCSKHVMNKMIALGSATLMTTIEGNAKVDSQSTVANESLGKEISSVKQPNGHYNCCNHVEEVMAADSTTVMTAVRVSEVSGANLTQHNNTIVVSQNAEANGNSGIESSRVQPYTGHTCCQKIENIMESGYTTVMTVIRINGSNLAHVANAIREVDSLNTVANATEGDNGNEHFKLNHAHENCSEMNPSASASVMAEINKNNNITSVTEKYSDIDLVASAKSGSENSALNGSPGNISPVSKQSKGIVPSSFFIEVSMIASTSTKSTLKINNTVSSSSEQDFLIVNKASLELVGNKATNNSLTNEIVQLESQNILVKTLVTLEEDDDDANKSKRGTKIEKKNSIENTSSAVVKTYHNRSEDDGKAVNDSFDSVCNKTSSDSNLSVSNVFNNSDNHDDCSEKISENTNLTVSSDGIKIISVLNSSINVNIGTMSQNEILSAASESAIAVLALGNGDRVSGTNRVLETDQTNEKPSETKMYFSAIKITTPKHVTGTSTNIINSTVTYPKSELEKSNTTLKEGPPILFNDRPQQNSQENADTLSMYTQSATIYTTPLGKENRSNITIDNFQEDANTNKYTTAASDEYKSELTSNVSKIISSYNNINKVLSQLGVADSFSNATLVQPASNITHKSNGTEKEFEMASSNVDKVLIEVYSEVNSKVDSPGTSNTSVDTRYTYSATLGLNATQSSPSDGQNKSASTDQNQLQEFGALNDSIADESVKSTWRNNIEIIPDITIVHSSSELYEKPEAGSRTTSKHSDVVRNEKISASDHLPQAVTVVTHTLPFNKTGSRVIPQGVNRELKKVVNLYVNNNVTLKMSASSLKNNSISSFRNHSEQSTQYSGTNSQKRLLNSSKKLSSNLTDVLVETKVADFSPTGDGSSNIRVQLQNSSTEETPKNSIVGKLNTINKKNRSMGNATKQTFSAIERKSEPTVLTADNGAYAPMLMIVTNTTEGRAKRKKRNVDFFPSNTIEQPQNTLLIPAEPERPEATAVAFKVATKNIPKAEEGMSIVYMLERSLSNDTSDETDKSSSSNYYYTVTLPAFFGILIGVIVCCVVLRAGGWCCRLFKNDSHSVLVEEVLAEHEGERKYTQSGDPRPSRRQSLM